MSWNIIIISDGQTGANRAALDFALKQGIPHGGWCAKGRQTLDGTLDPKYKLKEVTTEDGPDRTEWNVRDSDATVVLTLGLKATGTGLAAARYAKKTKKPCLHLHRGILGTSEKFIAFADKYSVRRLHISGSTEDDEPGINAWVDALLRKVHKEMEARSTGY
jgi:hypothetical protein